MKANDQPVESVLEQSGNDIGTYSFRACVPSNAIAADGTVTLAFVGLTLSAVIPPLQTIETFRLLSMKIDYAPGLGC